MGAATRLPLFPPPLRAVFEILAFFPRVHASLKLTAGAIQEQTQLL